MSTSRTQSSPPADATIWRRDRVLSEVGVSAPSLYRWVAAGRFPAPLRLGERARGWLSSDVRAWLDSRREARDAGATRTDGGGEENAAA